MVKLEERYFPEEEIRKDVRPYFDFGEVLLRTLEFDSLIDLGCSTGHLLYFLYNKNKQINGVEYFEWQKEAAHEDIRDTICIQDLRFPFGIQNEYGIDRYDVVNCTGVGERIDPEYTHILIDNIKRLAKKYVITTWSKDGGDPHGQHVNPLPYVTYRKYFIDNGFKPELDLTKVFIEHAQTKKYFYHWWLESLMIWKI